MTLAPQLSSSRHADTFICLCACLNLRQLVNSHDLHRIVCYATFFQAGSEPPQMPTSQLLWHQVILPYSGKTSIPNSFDRTSAKRRRAVPGADIRRKRKPDWLGEMHLMRVDIELHACIDLVHASDEALSQIQDSPRSSLFTDQSCIFAAYSDLLLSLSLLFLF